MNVTKSPLFMCSLCDELPFVNSVSVLSKEKAFLSPLKCIQKNMGDNEGLASLSSSSEPLVGKAFFFWISILRNNYFCLCWLFFYVGRALLLSPPRWHQTKV